MIAVEGIFKGGLVEAHGSINLLSNLVAVQPVVSLPRLGKFVPLFSAEVSFTSSKPVFSLSNRDDKTAVWVSCVKRLVDCAHR
jgi:hypothetical protein